MAIGAAVSVPGGRLPRVSASPLDSAQSSRVGDLCSVMIAVMRDRDFLHDDRVEQAFRRVPRDLFAPEVSCEGSMTLRASCAPNTTSTPRR